VKGVIDKNLPVLGSTIHSYEQQIRSAFRRRDRMSLNHRTAAWLGSYFDLLFAANRRFNPGEKRLLVHVQALPTAPEGGWSPMWKLLARGPAAWSAAWPTTPSSCARGRSASYALKGYSSPSSTVSKTELLMLRHLRGDKTALALHFGCHYRPFDRRNR
jgi:hypothetical protein